MIQLVDQMLVYYSYKILMKNQKDNLFINLNKFRYISQPILQIMDPLCSAQSPILSLQISEHGSNGIIYIETSNGSFVLKANNQAVNDYFFNKLGQTLGLSVPKMKIISCYEPQFYQIQFGIQKYCEKDEILYARIKSKINYPFYQIMEYIPSISLLHMGASKFCNNMIKKQKLYSMGMCLGFDILINNSDRFQLIWRGNGNINNVLLKIKASTQDQLLKMKDRNSQQQFNSLQYVFIDHTGCIFHSTDRNAINNMNKYLDMVSAFHLELLGYIRQQRQHLPKPFNKLKEQIEFFTQHQLTTEQLYQITLGIISITDQFIMQFSNSTFHQIFKKLYRVNTLTNKSEQQIYWDDYWNTDVDKINFSYLQKYYGKISAIYQTFGQVIEMVRSKTSEYIKIQSNNQRQISNKSSSISNKQQLRKDHDKETKKQNDYNSPNKNINISPSEISPDKEEDQINQHQQADKQKNNQQKQVNKKSKQWRKRLEIFKQNNYD